VVRTRPVYHRYDKRSTIRNEPEPERSQEDEQEKAYKKLKETQKKFQDAVWKNRTKTTAGQELATAGRDLLRGSGKAIDAFFDANQTISKSIERDIRRHSLEGKIDNTIIDWLRSEKKGSAKKKNVRPERYLKYVINGKTVMIPERDLSRPSSRRKRS
jgi:hypothetical protein